MDDRARTSPDPANVPVGPSPGDEQVADIAERRVRRPGAWAALLLGAAIAAAVAVFIAQNGQQVTLEWFWFDFRAGAWLALLVAFGAGLVASPLLVWSIRHAVRRRREERAVVRQHRTRRPADAGRTRVWPSRHRTT
jgi:uncharacterized integral membrane protein